MQPKIIPKEDELIAVFCTGILILSILASSAAVLTAAEEENEIVLVKLESPGQIERLKSVDLKIRDRYNRYVLIESGEDSIQTLQDMGLEVNNLPKRTEISVKGHRFDIEKGAPDFDAELTVEGYPEGVKGTYIVHTLGPVNPEWRSQLEDMGVDILNYVPNYAYEVRMTPETRERVEDLDFIDWTGIYHPEYKISDEIISKAETHDSGRIRVKFVSDADVKDVKSMLEVDPKAVITDTEFGFEAIVEVEELSTVKEIAMMKDVYYISPYAEPSLFSEVDAQIIGGGAWQMDDQDDNPGTAYRMYGDHGAYMNQIGYTGEGVVVTPADTGLGDATLPNAGHPDFTGRVIGGYSFNESQPDNWTDDHSHGTHTAGSIGGDTYDGTGTQYAGLDGEYYASQGLAYDSEMYAVKIFEGQTFMPEGEEYEIVEVAKQNGGTYVHSNSWGGARGDGAYDSTCSKYDTAARDADRDADGNQPMVLTVAAGNDGPDEETVAPPSIGKNVIAIGATQTYMPNSESYGARGDGTDNPDRVPDFSSRGWSPDGRVKPDVGAPGDEILSTMTPADTGDDTRGGYSNRENSLYDDYAPTEFGGGYSEDGRYEWMSGTSMANPTAAGAASVVVEWYEENYGVRPSPAMVKALMINTAQPCKEDQSGNGLIEYIPNKHEGWGRVDISKLEYPKDNPVPIDMEDQEKLLQTGDVEQYEVKAVRENRPLNLTLVWSDKEAQDGDDPTLKNNLDLEVESPSGDIYQANAFNSEAKNYSESSYTYPNTDTMVNFDTNGDGKDELNNVLNVFIRPEEVEEGFYNITVEGVTIAADGNNDGIANQDYALVVHNGEIIPPGDPPTVEVLSPNGGEIWEVGTEETIEWDVTEGDDPIANIDLQYSIDGGSTWDLIEPGPSGTGSGTYEWEVPQIDEDSDECLVKAVATDSIGRVSRDESDDQFSIYYPFNKPEIEITDPEDDADFTDSTVTVEWQSDYTDMHEVWLDRDHVDDVGPQETSYTFEGLEDGLHTVEIIAVGEKNSTDSDMVSFTVDTTPPEIEIESPEEGHLSPDDSVTVEWDGRDETSGIDHYEVRLEGGDWQDVGTKTNYTFEGLEDGEHTAEVQAFDNVQLSNADSVAFKVDTTPPSIEISSPEEGEMLSDSSVTIRWTSESDPSEIQRQEIYLDGELEAEDEQGDWVQHEITGLEEGNHSVEVRAINEAGHEASDSVGFSIDTEPPSLEITSPDSGELIGENQVTVKWESEARGSGIDRHEVRLDDSEWEEADSGGQHTFEDLADEEYTVEVKVTDEAGNEALESVVFTIDTEPPSLEIVSPRSGDVSGEDRITVHWDSEPKGSEITLYEVRSDGGEWKEADSEDEHTFEDLPDGERTLEVKVTDQAGNDAVDEISILIDTTPPELDIISPEVGAKVEKDSVIIDWSGNSTGSEIVSYQIRIDDGEWKKPEGQTIHTFKNLDDGSHTVEIRAVDEAGNERVESVYFDVDKPVTSSYWWLIPLLVVIVVLLLIFGVIWKRREEEDEDRTDALREGEVWGEEKTSRPKPLLHKSHAKSQKDKEDRSQKPFEDLQTHEESFKEDRQNEIKEENKVRSEDTVDRTESKETKEGAVEGGETEEDETSTDGREESSEEEKIYKSEEREEIEEEEEEEIEGTIECPVCGREVDPDAEKCWACGEILTEED
ncbi:MAG: S8 family serine peptidase [Candidatus Aenigmatarchaeota archaeon]